MRQYGKSNPANHKNRKEVTSLTHTMTTTYLGDVAELSILIVDEKCSQGRKVKSYPSFY